MQVPVGVLEPVISPAKPVLQTQSLALVDRVKLFEWAGHMVHVTSFRPEPAPNCPAGQLSQTHPGAL